MKRHPWETLSDKELLKVRLRDLHVRVDGTWIEECLAELYDDLERRDIRFRPHVWLSNEWFVPDSIPGIAVPFYLAHPRLMKLERRQMIEVEGGTRPEMMKILRHECGHALDNAFLLAADNGRQELFGKSSKRYPELYRPNPASRRYVRHLRLYYAQSHPLEDFAETFAVILAAHHESWRKRYEGWPALRKLEYVDALLDRLRGKRPVVRSRGRIDPLSELTMTLGEYYEEKHQRYVVSYPDIYDRDLRRLFSDDPRHGKRELASHFLRRNRAEIRKIVAEWTGEYEFTLNHVLNDMIGRSRELKLRVSRPESRLKIDFAILLAVKTMDFHYSRNWFAL